MKCRKVLRLIPLAAGDDLGPRRARAFRAHVDACPNCRNELEAHRAALAAFRTAAKEEELPDWTEGEWKVLMDRVTGGGKDRREAQKDPRARAYLPRWAAASVLGALLGVVVLSILFRGPVPGPERTRAAAPEEQDVVSMTMVSRETGLQVVWFFDKKFDYEGVNK